MNPYQLYWFLAWKPYYYSIIILSYSPTDSLCFVFFLFFCHTIYILQPKAVFFTCMDSRMIPTRYTDTHVGDMFVGGCKINSKLKSSF